MRAPRFGDVMRWEGPRNTGCLALFVAPTTEERYGYGSFDGVMLQNGSAALGVSPIGSWMAGCGPIEGTRAEGPYWRIVNED